MPIHVYERFELESTASQEHSNSDIGDLWEIISWDMAASSWFITSPPTWGWKLTCDWRMPAAGVLKFMNPVKDESIEFRYNTPSLTISRFVPGAIKQRYFTEDLKRSWEALPTEWTCSIGKMTLICHKDIIDAIEASPLGVLYIYRPVEIRIG